MAILLHDTLTGGKRELVPLEPGKIRFYACGPTVYDFSHVGHARSYVVWDVVVRHLRARGYQVCYAASPEIVRSKTLRLGRRASAECAKSPDRLGTDGQCGRPCSHGRRARQREIRGAGASL